MTTSPGAHECRVRELPPATGLDVGNVGLVPLPVIESFQGAAGVQLGQLGVEVGAGRADLTLGLGLQVGHNQVEMLIARATITCLPGTRRLRPVTRLAQRLIWSLSDFTKERAIGE